MSSKNKYVLSSLYSLDKKKEMKKVPNEYFILSYLNNDDNDEMIQKRKKQVAEHLLVSQKWNDFEDWKIQQWISFMEYLINSQNRGEIDQDHFDRYTNKVLLCLNFIGKRNYLAFIKSQYKTYFETERLHWQMRARWAIHAE